MALYFRISRASKEGPQSAISGGYWGYLGFGRRVCVPDRVADFEGVLRQSKQNRNTESR